MIELPWESEHVLESCKGFMDASSVGIVASLISSLKNPTEFAILITLDEEKIESVATGFMAKMKSMANSAASQAVKVQRQVTATNKFASVYDVKFVLPLCRNLRVKIAGDSIVFTWKESVGEKMVKISNLSSQWMNVFTATREISVTKFRQEFLAQGTNGLFKWLWKYQPNQILPDTSSAVVLGEKVLGNLLCFTWNVAGMAPPENSIGGVIDCSKLKTDLIEFFSLFRTDIVLLCLQEASPLNAKTVMFKGDNLGDLWMEFIQDCLECAGKKIGKTSPWVKAAGTIQVGLAIGLFVNESSGSVAKISSPLTSCVKTGTLGLTGNKGSVALYTNIGFKNGLSMSVSILNLHLASGEGKSDFRKSELVRVINESSFGDNKEHHFFDANLSIVTGDLNSRMLDENKDCSGLEISNNDELIARMETEKGGFLFRENQVTFAATYKLLPGQQGRLVFAEHRKPGWCDRILFRSNGDEAQFTCSEYNSARQIDFSDHTPVYGMFNLMETSAQEAAPQLEAEEKNSEASNDSDLYDN